MEEELRSRFKEVLNFYNSNINQLANGESSTQVRLSRQINKGASITYDTIVILLEAFPKVSAEWLLRGKGEMIVASSQESTEKVNTEGLFGDVPYSLKEGSLLLIKTSTNKILESKNIIPEYKTFDIPHNNIYGRYPFNESEITEIIKGIVKIRVEAPLKTIDIEYSSKKTKQISKGLTERYNDIKKSLFIKKDIRSNF